MSNYFLSSECPSASSISPTGVGQQLVNQVVNTSFHYAKQDGVHARASSVSRDCAVCSRIVLTVIIIGVTASLVWLRVALPIIARSISRAGKGVRKNPITVTFHISFVTAEHLVTILVWQKHSTRNLNSLLFLWICSCYFFLSPAAWIAPKRSFWHEEKIFFLSLRRHFGIGVSLPLLSTVAA